MVGTWIHSHSGLQLMDGVMMMGVLAKLTTLRDVAADPPTATVTCSVSGNASASTTVSDHCTGNVAPLPTATASVTLPLFPPR